METQPVKISTTVYQTSTLLDFSIKGEKYAR